MHDALHRTLIGTLGLTIVDCVALLYFVPSMTYVTVSVAHKLLAEQCVVKTSILAAFGSRIQ